jgi:hypothetical protein
MHSYQPDQNAIMADGSGSGLFLFGKNARDTDLNRQIDVKFIEFLSTLPTTNEKGKPVRYLVYESFIFQEEVGEMPNMDNNIEDDNKIRVIGETQ